VETGYRIGSGRNGPGGEGTLSLDARKDTEFGPLRLYVEPKINTGTFGP
jgi:hypothetical protein